MYQALWDVLGTHIFSHIPEGDWEVFCGVVHCLYVEEESLERVRKVQLELHHAEHDKTNDDGIANYYRGIETT